MKSTRAQLTAALPIALMATLALAACSAGGNSEGGPVTSAITADASGQSCAAPGDGSDGVRVAGEFGDQLELTSKTPVSVDALQRSVLIEGEGDVLPTGENAMLSVTIFNGKSGDPVNFIGRDSLPNDSAQLASLDWAYQAVRCSAPGQRVSIVVPAAEAVEDLAAAGFTDMTPEDSFIFVIDFVKPFDQFEDCDSVAPRDEQYPKVELFDESTSPKVTIPECMAAPEEIELTVLEEGDGPVIEDGDVVMTSYVGVTWNGAEVFNDNWDATGIRFDTRGVIKGFREALVGQKLGSTMLVNIPAADAYGSDGPSAANNYSPLAGQALTFVLKPISLTE